MLWAILVGSVIFLITVGGMFFMRNRPLRDAHGNVVDEFGRPVVQLSNDANVVLITLRNSGEPLSGYDLRRHVTLPRQDFYAMMTDLEHRNLIGNVIDNLGTHRVRKYFLTNDGRALFDGNTAA